MKKNLLCPVCDGACSLLDVVDFNKSCEEVRGKFLALSGVPCYYAQCTSCDFCFAPQIASWELAQFEENIYNADYVLVDPDYVDFRPRANAAHLASLFGNSAGAIRHLDYGGGSGLLSSVLTQSNWQSITYDPFVNRTTDIADLGTFDLISAFEVFEHVPDPQLLMSNLRSLLAPNGMIVFSTLVSDGNIQANQRLSWWYASPRNGHISLFSKKSLEFLAQKYGFRFGSFTPVFHVLCTSVPTWAKHVVRGG